MKDVARGFVFKVNFSNPIASNEKKETIKSSQVMNL